MRRRRRASGLDTSTPVLLLGGAANALSLMRSYGRMGIDVSAMMARSVELRSRFCHRGVIVPSAADASRFFAAQLLPRPPGELHGAILLACGDDAIRFIAENATALRAAGYVLERNDPQLRLALLDKARTLELGVGAGVPTPRTWPAEWPDCMAAAEGAGIAFPVILKPLDTHAHHAAFGHKFRVARTLEELRAHRDVLFEREIPFVVCELVPGPDRNHESYYGYRRRDGTFAFELTKRCVRRRPMNEGTGTYQITEDLPDVARLGRAFFEYTGYQGFGNLEFKRDARTGTLKLLECNSRFTAVQEQLLASGVDSDLVVYRDLTGQPTEPSPKPEESVAIWWPFRDLQAFAEARAANGERWLDWPRSLSHRKVVFPYFSVTDPAPIAALLAEEVTRLVRRGTGRRTASIAS
jgi:predicted ATP-grasp superfamily ATP-dependent carboligase